MLRYFSAGLFGICVALASRAVTAQSVCVECKGPDRGYRCSIKGSERVQGIRGSSRGIEMICLSEIARVGGHDVCRIDKTYAGPCIGQHHEVDLSKAVESAPTQPASPDGAQPSDKSAATSAPDKQGPPQTLEELARQTMAKSKEQMSEADKQVKKAGEAVGGAVQQTWDCLTSLFKRC